MESFDQTLEKYGADLAAVRSFDTDAPDLLPYATLFAAHKANDSVLAALTGVYEWQNTPLVFLVEGDRLAGDEALNHIRRLVAMRGDAPYLGVVRPGQLTLYRVSLDKDPPDKTRIHLNIPDGEERATFPQLSNCRPGVAPYPRQWISEVVLTLLSTSIEELKTEFKVAGNDAISLVGRALFTRFLADRALLPSSLLPGGQKEAAVLFDNAQRSTETSTWLDVTFNGDFLPVSGGLFASLPPQGFKTLGDILRRAPGGQLSLGWEEKWENLDFAYIPVGVLSQAYEHYLREHAPTKQRKEGGYYTPRIIADMMVRGAFHALRRDAVAYRARILDAAAGAGVFLITAFRELVSERWRHDRVRPDTKTLREILYGQITGFDINESALRFAALGLYLVSIELDPNPEPVEKLRFQNLRGTVLYNVGVGEDNSNLPSQSLGSLGNDVGEIHSGRYDLVIGNPPWASGTGLPDWQQVAERVEGIAKTRVPDRTSPKLPNEVLDLPFVWRAMQWAKPGGQIAFALHARLLFQQGEGMPEDRSALFGALNVTGIVNGSEIRQTKVWPQISAPFCLLFARNELPPPGAGFRFVSPRLEDSLNGAGGLRVDASNAEMITSDQVTHRPEILKILFRGSQLDLEVYDRLMSRKLRTLDEFWRAYFGEFHGRPRFTGNGYQKLRKSSEIRKAGRGQAGVSALELRDLPELTPAAMQTPLVDSTRLVPFHLQRIHRARLRELFRSPLLLVHKSPPAQAGRIRVAVAYNDLVFNQTFYGYSAKEHPDGKRLVRYLAMLVGSKWALWFALITSGEFGFEREAIEKLTIDKIPVPRFEAFDSSDLKQIDSLFADVARQGSEEAWVRVDAWVASLYGLRKRDLRVITDTLSFNLPFSRCRNAAQARPTPTEIADFCGTLSSELSPWAQRAGKEILVRPLDLSPASPWGVVQVGAALASPILAGYKDWPEIVRVADQLAATEVMHPDTATGCLWLARLNQARYWSRSQARLVARRIAWEHVDFLSGLKGR